MTTATTNPPAVAYPFRSSLRTDVRAPIDVPGLEGPAEFIGKDPKILEMFDVVARIAGTDATVLVHGECGTGKEYIARALHLQSARPAKLFFPVNSGAIAEGLLESELFGHSKGAFTGADAQRVGLFERASGGTIFFDEVAEMSKALQVKLLRVLQSGEYSPVGVSDVRTCDVRIIAATNRDLRSLVESGAFRQDLYYRLNVIRIDLPPLRQRRGDILPLVEHYLRHFGRRHGKPGLTLSREAEDVLLRYDFPGNVRELKNIVERGVHYCTPPVVTARDLPPELTDPEVRAPTITTAIPFHEAKAQAIEHFERTYLVSMLKECGGIVSRAAQKAQLCERNFHEKLKRYGINGKEYRA